jgi:hypothetical protein
VGGCFFFLVVLPSFLSRHSWVTPPPLFAMGFFKIRSLKLFARGWLQTLIFPISASWVARITSLSHQCPGKEEGELFRSKIQVYWNMSFNHLLSKHLLSDHYVLGTVYTCSYKKYFHLIFFFWLHWGLNSGPHDSLYCLSHSTNPFLCWVFLR